MEFLIELFWTLVFIVATGYLGRLARIAGMSIASYHTNLARILFVVFALLSMGAFFILVYCAMFSHQYPIDPLVMSSLLLVIIAFTNSLRLSIEHDW